MIRTSDRETGRETGVDLLSPAETVRDALSFALGFTATRLGQGEGVVELLKQDHAEAHEYFRYALALRLGEWLAKADGTTKAVYTYSWGDPPEETEADPVVATSPLSIILWVDRKTAAINALAVELDAALTNRYRGLVAPAADKLRSLLDLNLVDDRDVAERTGYGALVMSMREPPLKVWSAHSD